MKFEEAQRKCKEFIGGNGLPASLAIIPRAREATFLRNILMLRTQVQVQERQTTPHSYWTGLKRVNGSGKLYQTSAVTFLPLSSYSGLHPLTRSLLYI